MKKIKSQVFLSLDINDINLMIVDFLKKRGYIILNILSLEDIKIFANSGELITEVEESNNELTEESGKILFSGIFLSRIGSLKTKLGMFINNVSENQVQSLSNKAFLKMEKREQDLLSFSYNLKGNEDLNFTKVKKLIEIENKFNLNNPLKELNKALSKFAKILNQIFLTALSEKSLTLNKVLSKDDKLDMKIIDAGFCKRTYNSFRSEGVEKISNLIEFKINDLRKFRHLGQLGIEEFQTFRQLYEI